MAFDTYVDEMRCPQCNNVGEFELHHSEAGDGIFLNIAPNDFVSEWRGDKRTIDGPVECESCGAVSYVIVPIFFGVVGRMYAYELPDGIFEAETILERLRMAVEHQLEEKRDYRHALDVIRTLILFWKDGVGDWNVEEDGLPPVGRNTSADNLVDAIEAFVGHWTDDADV